MRHLCLISLMWAIAYSLPKYLIDNKQLDAVLNQQEITKKQLEIKQVEQQFLQKLLNPETSRKGPEASFRFF